MVPEKPSLKSPQSGWKVGSWRNLPVDGRARVTAWVIADTHVTLVQLHCHVVAVPIVQQDPVVLGRGHLVGKGTFSATPS